MRRIRRASPPLQRSHPHSAPRSRLGSSRLLGVSESTSELLSSMDDGTPFALVKRHGKGCDAQVIPLGQRPRVSNDNRDII